MSSLIGKEEGLYNPTLRFAFTNITTEDFHTSWGGNPIVVKAGETVELPHHLADKFTDQLVDQIMIGEAKLDEVKYYQENRNAAPNTYRAPNMLGVPAARKVWEDKIVRQLAVDEESPQMQVMRAQIREQLESDLKAETSTAPVQAPTSLSEFAELGSGGKPKEPETKEAPVSIPKINTPAPEPVASVPSAFVEPKAEAPKEAPKTETKPQA